MLIESQLANSSQTGLVRAIERERGWSARDASEMLLTKFGLNSHNDIRSAQVDDIIAELRKVRRRSGPAGMRIYPAAYIAKAANNVGLEAKLIRAWPETKRIVHLVKGPEERTCLEAGEAFSVTALKDATFPKPWMKGWASSTERHACLMAAADREAERKVEVGTISAGDKEWLKGIEVDDDREVCRDLLQRLGATRAGDKLAQAAADIGTAGHEAVEKWLKEGDDAFNAESLEPDTQLILDGAKSFFDYVNFDPVGIEACVWSERERVAGTCDFFGFMDAKALGKLVGIDLGSGRLRIGGDLKSSKAIYVEHCVQQAAYNEMAEECGVASRAIEGGLILRSPKTKEDLARMQKKYGRPYELRYIGIEEQTALWDLFLKTRDFAIALLETGAMK